MILLKNATYIDRKTLEFKSVNILVEEGINGNITFVEDSNVQGVETLDCKGKLVTKAFAVGHHHV
ncbi:MAG: hypothetical protein DRJ07_03455, partial [Bacteroidetes bacterium]